MLATHHHPTIVHFSRPWSCVHLQKGMVQENAGNLKPGCVLQHGTLNAGSLRNVCILKCFILCLRDSVSGRRKNI